MFFSAADVSCQPVEPEYSKVISHHFKRHQKKSCIPFRRHRILVHFYWSYRRSEEASVNFKTTNNLFTSPLNLESAKNPCSTSAFFSILWTVNCQNYTRMGEFWTFAQIIFSLMWVVKLLPPVKNKHLESIITGQKELPKR